MSDTLESLLDTRQSEGPDTQFSHTVTGSKSSERIENKAKYFVKILTSKQNADLWLHFVILSEEGVEGASVRSFAHLVIIVI